MKCTYHIEGMTCNGCRSHVEHILEDLTGVEKASVHLENKKATLKTTEPLNLALLQNALPEKYRISEIRNVDTHSEPKADGNATKSSEKSKLQQLKPLLLIFFYITLASVLLHRSNWNGTKIMLDFMGLFYIVFSFFKLLDLKGFSASFRMYDPLAKKFPAYGWAYPFIETTLGLMFLLRFEIPIALVATLIVLGITTFGVTKTLLDKKSIQCACLGTALKLPMTEATFIENTIMISMAIFILTQFI